MIRNFVIDNMIYCSECIPDDMNKIVIYCHGFGENKERINQHNLILSNNKIGIVTFDLPCHGEDMSNDNCFTLTNSVNYLNKVIDYTRKYNVPISLMGSSYGGYVILSRINKIDELFDKVFLKFPAVNFYECTKRKLNIDIDYFEYNEYYLFSNGIKLYKESFIEFMNNNLMYNFNKHNNDIYVIHGDKDKTVLLTDVQYFCNKYNIKLDIIKGAEHGMKYYLDIVNDKLVEYIK